MKASKGHVWLQDEVEEQLSVDEDVVREKAVQLYSHFDECAGEGKNSFRARKGLFEYSKKQIVWTAWKE